jgi:hypothetical protein
MTRMLQEYVQGYQKSPSPWSVSAVPDPREDGLGYSERRASESESESESERESERHSLLGKILHTRHSTLLKAIVHVSSSSYIDLICHVSVHPFVENTFYREHWQLHKH